MGKAYTNGVMDENMKGNGFTTKCMGMEYIHIQMGGNMKVRMQMISVKVPVNFFGLMEDFMMESGKRESSMA